MTLLSCKREWKLSCVHSPNWQWSIEMSEEHPINSIFWYNTGLFSVVSPMFHNRNCWKLSLRVLFSIESVKINSSRISVDNCLCWLNKKGLDDCKKITVKLKWNSISNTVELSIVYFPSFYYYELILSTPHDVNVETIQFHIFPTFSFLRRGWSTWKCTTSSCMQTSRTY